MKAILVTVTWLTLGPQVSTQTFEQLAECRAAMRAVASMVQQGALTNLTGPHRDLVLQDDDTDSVLRTPSTGREVVRLRCVSKIR